MHIIDFKAAMVLNCCNSLFMEWFDENSFFFLGGGETPTSLSPT